MRVKMSEREIEDYKLENFHEKKKPFRKTL